MTTFSSPEDAKAYILKRDADAKRYTAESKSSLATRLRCRRAAQGTPIIHGDPGRWSHDELVNDLLDMDYPHDTLDAARTAYCAAKAD
jgi:hypothetical protein